MTNENNWFGTDASQEISLFEYGFLIREQTTALEEFDVIYKYGERFFYSTISIKEIDQMIRDTNSVKSFIDINGIDIPYHNYIMCTYLETFLSDALTVLSCLDLFGSPSHEGQTGKEIADELGLMFDE